MMSVSIPKLADIGHTSLYMPPSYYIDDKKLCFTARDFAMLLFSQHKEDRFKQTI